MRRRDTSRNKTFLNRACFAHNLSTASLSKWGWNGPHGLATHENLGNKLNTTQRLQFVRRKIWFNKFIKSVNRLLSEYWYLCVNSEMRFANTRQARKYRLGQSSSIITMSDVQKQYYVFCLHSLSYPARRILSSFVACFAAPHFSALSHTRYDFREKVYIKCVLIFSTCLHFSF